MKPDLDWVTVVGRSAEQVELPPIDVSRSVIDRLRQPTPRTVDRSLAWVTLAAACATCVAIGVALFAAPDDDPMGALTRGWAQVMTSDSLIEQVLQ